MVRSLSFAFTLSTAVMICGISYAGDNDDRISPFPVQQGFAISPVELNLAGKDPLKVGLGSYLVNAIGDCSGCHSFPQYLEKRGPGTNPLLIASRKSTVAYVYGEFMSWSVVKPAYKSASA